MSRLNAWIKVDNDTLKAVIALSGGENVDMDKVHGER